MAKNLRLGQYKSLNALAKVFEIRDEGRYLFFLEKYKPFWLDKNFPKIEEDFEKKQLDAKTLYWMVKDMAERADKCAAKDIKATSKKMETWAEKEDLTGFWELYPTLKENVDHFLDDYYKIFPHLKPAEEIKAETKDEPKDGPKDDPKDGDKASQAKEPEKKKEPSSKALNALPEIPP